MTVRSSRTDRALFQGARGNGLMPSLRIECLGAAMRDRRARCIRSCGTVHAARGIAASLFAPWASSFSISSDVIRTASFNASSMWT